MRNGGAARNKMKAPQNIEMGDVVSTVLATSHF